MMGAVVTGSVAMAALGAFYLLMHQFEEFGQTFVRLVMVPFSLADLSLGVQILQARIDEQLISLISG
jgi:multidrug efflux pump subunit AcrB